MATWLSNGELRFEPSSFLRAPAPITVQTGYLRTVDTGPRMCLFCLVDRLTKSLDSVCTLEIIFPFLKTPLSRGWTPSSHVDTL